MSGEVADWRNLAQRSIADLEATGVNIRLDTVARRIDVAHRQLLVADTQDGEKLLDYDALVVGTGAEAMRPAIRD